MKYILFNSFSYTLYGLSLILNANAENHSKKNVPNILFILCDDMGFGDLGCYGQQHISTPNIDRMAAEGMLFTQAYAGSPVSAPSRATLMTGQHTGHVYVRGNREHWPGQPMVSYGINQEYAVSGQEPYDPQHIILPEIMKKNGYTTGMFGKWSAGYEGSNSVPEKRGIDEFFGYICQYQAHLYYPNFLNRYSKSKGDTTTIRIILEDNIKYPMYGEGYEKRTQYSADMIHRAALEWLDSQDGKQPFYGLFTYTLPHAELVQPNDSILKEYKKKFFEDKTWGGAGRYNPTVHTHAQFAGMITRLDTYVGEIFKKLNEKGLSDNTIVIFSSDNGPHNEGGADRDFFYPNGTLRGIKRQCHEGGIRVPFIVWWPEQVRAGSVNEHQLVFYDVMPTFCDIINDKRFPKEYWNKQAVFESFDGISFLPTLLGNDEEQKRHDFLYWEFHETDQIAVRMGNWKLVVKQGIPHLYDLEFDFHEDYNVAAKYPEIVRKMKEIILQEHVENDLFKVTLPN